MIVGKDYVGPILSIAVHNTLNKGDYKVQIISNNESDSNNKFYEFNITQWGKSFRKKENFIFSNQISFANQILIARKITRNLTLQLSPTMLHYNLVEINNESNDKFSLAIGGRQKLSQRISLNAEYFYQLNL